MAKVDYRIKWALALVQMSLYDKADDKFCSPTFKARVGLGMFLE